MSGFLVIIRKGTLQCTPEAAIPCRKVVAADVVAETPTQPTELHDRKRAFLGGLGNGVGGCGGGSI